MLCGGLRLAAFFALTGDRLFRFFERPVRPGCDPANGPFDADVRRDAGLLLSGAHWEENTDTGDANSETAWERNFGYVAIDRPAVVLPATGAPGTERRAMAANPTSSVSMDEIRR